MMKCTKEEILQNLKDAGCEDDMIEEFMQCISCKKDGDEMKLLAEHRECLLEHVHEEEQKISCLDYLSYRLKKMNEE